MRRVALILMLVGCDGDPEPAVPSPPGNAARAVTSEDLPEPRTPAPARTEGPRPGSEGGSPSRTLSPEDREAVRSAIGAGRVATRAGNLQEAREHFDRALELSPRDSGLHCEAGFAAVNGSTDEDRAYALEHLNHGLALLGREPPPARRMVTAMCLYNRGLLDERARRWDRAAARYQRSLSLRPNPTVRRHLEAVRAGAALEDESTERAGSLAALVEQWNGVPQGEERTDDDELRHELRRTIPGSGTRPEVGLIGFDVGPEWGTILAVRVAGGYRTTTVATGIDVPYSMNASGTSVQAVEHPAPGWIRLDLRTETSMYVDDTIDGPEDDTFCALTSTREDRTSELGLCTLGPPLECRSGLIGRRGNAECEVDCDGSVPEEYERDTCGDFAEDDPAYALTVETDAARGVRLTLADGELPEEAPLPLGQWIPFAEAFTQLARIH